MTTHQILQIQEIQERVRSAANNQRPLRLRGSGSKDFHALALEGEILDLQPLSGILSYEPTELVITARAGTPLQQIEDEINKEGQMLAFEPPQFDKASTVGGVVAAGCSGPARASVGAVRDFVLGAEIINGKGELLRYGGQVMKNVAGYDVSRLLAGSWGVLGVITEVSLKVLPIPPADTTLRFDMTQAQALAALHEWCSRPLPLNASAWHNGQLWLRLRGARAAVNAACLHLGGETLKHEQAQTFWNSLRHQHHPWFDSATEEACLWRLSLPATAPELEMPGGASAPLFEWHGAQRWVHAPRSAGQQLEERALALGGSAVLWRGASGEKISASPIFLLSSPSLLRIHQQLKAAFDPHGIFNPGRTGL